MIYRNLLIASFQIVKATAPYRGTMPSSDFKRRFSVFLLWSPLVTKIFQASHRKKSYNSRQIVCGFVTILCRGKKKTRPTRWFAFNAKKTRFAKSHWFVRTPQASSSPLESHEKVLKIFGFHITAQISCVLEGYLQKLMKMFYIAT